MKTHKQVSMIVTIVIAVVAFALGFGGGTMYAGSGSAARQGNGNGQFARQAGGAMGGAGARGGMNRGAGFVAGDVMSIDAQSITLKLRDGGQKIVFYSASTTVSRMAAGAVSDLVAGSAVVVDGKTNQDGSVTANSIQVR